jgi:Trk K+ transport system NAD-binding subunit
MNTTSALIFGFNKFAIEIYNQVQDKYKIIKFFSLDKKDIENKIYTLKHFDLSDDWEDIKNIVDIRKSIVFCALEDDAKNIFLTISLRANFNKLNIISLASNKESANKLKMAGATKVIPIVETTADIITDMLEKPISNTVIDNILYEKSALKIEQIKITNNTNIRNKQLLDIDWSKYEAIVVLSIMYKDKSIDFIYSSKAKNNILNVGDELVVIGYENDIIDFKKNIGSE